MAINILILVTASTALITILTKFFGLFRRKQDKFGCQPEKMNICARLSRITDLGKLEKELQNILKQILNASSLYLILDDSKIDFRQFALKYAEPVMIKKLSKECPELYESSKA